LLLAQPARVFDARLGIVQRARAHDHHEAVVGSLQHAVDRLARAVDERPGRVAGRELAQQVRRRRELLDLADADVVHLVRHARLLGRLGFLRGGRDHDGLIWVKKLKKQKKTASSVAGGFRESGEYGLGSIPPPAGGKAVKEELE